MKVIYLVILVSYLSTYVVNAKYVEGELSTPRNWEFLARFCFLSHKGKFKFEIEYPVEYEVQRLLLYYDSPSQWQSVYASRESCMERLKPLNATRKQFVNLTINRDVGGYFTGCRVYKPEGADGRDWYRCENYRTFKSSRERWWYIAVANCESRKGLWLRYRITMTNGDEGIWFYQFSADEFYVIHIYLVACFIYTALLVTACVIASHLRARLLFHTTYKLFLTSLIFQFLSSVTLTSAYFHYGSDGVGKPELNFLGLVLESTASSIFLLVVLLMAKGYTITRGRLRQASSIKLCFFMCLYCVCYASLFFHQHKVADPARVLYMYQCPPGYGIIILQCIAWFMFLYSTFFTVKHYPAKRTFYLRFFLYYTIWFITVPITILLANHVIPAWVREKVATGIRQAVILQGYIGFMMLTIPSKANKNFPFHVRTTQIDIMEHEPTGADGDNTLDAFTQDNYAVPQDKQNGNVFTVSGVLHMEPQQPTVRRFSREKPPIFNYSNFQVDMVPPPPAYSEITPSAPENEVGLLHRPINHKIEEEPMETSPLNFSK